MKRASKYLEQLIGIFATLYVVLGIVLIIIHTITRRDLLEFPEKDLISICIAAITLVVIVANRRNYSRGIQVTASILALIIGVYTMLTKAIVFWIAGDGDIAQWHMICTWIGALTIAVTQRLKRT